MYRLKTGWLLIPTIALAFALSGCLGKSSSNPGDGGVKSVSLNPSGTISIDVGNIQNFTASATDAQGRSVIGTIRYQITTPPGSTGAAPISMTNSGSACAGTWDQTLSLCQAGTSGIAIVTVLVNGVSSQPTTVYVHQHVDSLQAVNAEQSNPPYDCFSQGNKWTYQALAFSKGQDITSTVGPLSWNSTNVGVLTTATQSSVPTLLPNQVEITAASPGVTRIFATISGTASNSLPVTTCLVKYIRVQASGSTTNSIVVANGSSITLNATAVDTLGFELAKPPLTWSTTNPEVVSFTSLTTSTVSNSASAHSNLGGATITASCTPPTCNIGVRPGMPVYASNGLLPPPSTQQGYGAISVDVITKSKLSTYTAWAATDQCAGQTGCSSTMFGINPTATNPIAGTINLPRTPNSMLFNHGSRVYLGSDQGLMYADVGGTSTSATLVSNSPTPCNVSLCGKVLALSNDGKLVVVGDTVSSQPQAYIFNSASSATTDLVLSDVATAAAFSPDQSKIFLLTNNGLMYVYSTVDTLGYVPIATSPTGATFSADGSIGYVATSPSSVTAFSTCALPNLSSVNLGSVGMSGLPLQLNLSPVTQVVPVGSDLFTQEQVFALEPPNVQFFTSQYKQTDVVDGQFTCNPPTLNSLVAGTTYNLGQGNFTPVYSRLVGDGAAMIIVARGIPAVLIFSITDGTTTSVPLANVINPPYPLSASSSSDGSQVFVAACDQYPNNDPSQPCTSGSVHVVNTTSQAGKFGDYLQVPYTNNSTNNMCNNLGENAPLCTPNMIAVKPQ
jgi:hypothetical protein